MDHFHEEVVVKHKRTMDEIAYYVTAVIMVFAALMGMMGFTSSISGIAVNGFAAVLPTLLISLVNIGLAVALFLFRDRLRTEYEYTFTNGALDFAQVYNNRKRKSLGSLDVRKVDAFGPVSGSAFQRYISMPNVKQSRWFLNRDGNLYFFYFQKDSNKRVIVLEPTEELARMIETYLPFGALQK